MFFGFVDPRKTRMPDPSEALPGRDEPIVIASPHAVLGSSLDSDWDGMELHVRIRRGLGNINSLTFQTLRDPDGLDVTVKGVPRAPAKPTQERGLRLRVIHATCR